MPSWEKLLPELLDEATQLLENSARSATNATGHRPQYPVIVAINGENVDASLNQIYKKISWIWSKSVMNHLVFFSYYTPKGNDIPEYQLYENDNDGTFSGQKVSLNQLNQRIQELYIGHNAFLDMTRTCLYHIIDTSKLNTLSEFKQQLTLKERLATSVNSPVQALLVIILDETESGIELSDEIKQYLLDQGATPSGLGYQGGILLSNWDRSSHLYTKKPLMRAIANVILLSNSSGNGVQFVQEFRNRSNVIFNNRYHLLSHTVLERPNRQIAYQMLEAILQEPVPVQQNLDRNGWAKLLHLEQEDNQMQKYVGNTGGRLDVESLAHFPMNRIPSEPLTAESIRQTRYQDFENISFPDVVERFVETYCSENQGNSASGIEDAVQKTVQRIQETVPAEQLAFCTEEIIHQLFESFTWQEPDKRLLFEDYLKKTIQKVEWTYTKEVFQEKLFTLCQKARESAEQFRQLRANIFPRYSVDGERIGTLFQNLVPRYFQWEKNRADLMELHAAGLTEEELKSRWLNVLQRILDANPEVTQMPFLTMWKNMLQAAGAEIYRKIHGALSDGDQRIWFTGPFPNPECESRMLMFCSQDAGGGKSQLCDNLVNAFQGLPLQIFNTGYNDAIEEMQFYPCSRDTLAYSIRPKKAPTSDLR